mmetsp:Transcript_8133/g.13477  ORF Transcript_8133/g.13477 Transcript_8133/m.13477 type:complete len:111 (-) Transcript_8133:2257-2589(-)
MYAHMYVHKCVEIVNTTCDHPTYFFDSQTRDHPTHFFDSQIQRDTPPNFLTLPYPFDQSTIITKVSTSKRHIISLRIRAILTRTLWSITRLTVLTMKYIAAALLVILGKP